MKNYIIILLAIFTISCSKEELVIEEELPIWYEWNSTMLVGLWENGDSTFLFNIVEDYETNYTTTKIVCLYSIDGGHQVYANAFFHEDRILIKDKLFKVTHLDDETLILNGVEFKKRLK